LLSNKRTPRRGQQQLTWTCLPQGFKNSPTIFGTALASDLRTYPAEEAGCTLLKYVDDLLLTAANHQDYLKETESLLRLLREAGYKVLRRPRSVKTKSNIWGFTSPKASGTSVQKENKLFNPDSNFKTTNL
jgi:hypothetical protein